MGITSFYFWIFLLFFGAVYFLFPRKNSYLVLLAASLLFLDMTSGTKSLFYVLAGVPVIYFAARGIGATSDPKRKKWILVAALVLVVGELALLKYTNGLLKTISGFLEMLLPGKKVIFPVLKLMAPLGISYYTLSLIGYLLDVYWGKYPPEKSFLKCLLFACYFPQLTSGPITRYDHMAPQLFVHHTFEPKRVLFGIQRILWGLFKKLVIADRAAIFVNAIYAEPELYPGLYITVAILLFALQLYTDFSGCMDIIMGVSECFGIFLPENFNTPFFSESVAEFWRRWHITMGLWFKEYLLYPILKSDSMQNLSQRIRKRRGKKKAKAITNNLGLVVIWLVIGIWHGGEMKFILASGILPGFFLVMGEVCSPLFGKLNRLLRINTEAESWHVFRMVRTFLCLCCSWVFVRAENCAAGFQMLRKMFSQWNPWVLVDNVSLFQHGLDYMDFNILWIGLLLIWGVGMLHRRNVSLREILYRQNVAAQGLLLMAALFGILIFGIYGPAYDASSFIYKNF